VEDGSYSARAVGIPWIAYIEAGDAAGVRLIFEPQRRNSQHHLKYAITMAGMGRDSLAVVARI
jgi:hypothetical protein